jgi:hypothetical protein
MRSPRRLVVVALSLVLGRSAVAHAAPTVSVQATAAASSLDLDGEGSAQTHIVKVAEVALASDAAQGFTVFVSADRLSVAGGTPIALQVVLVPDGAPAPSSADFTTPSGSTYTFATATAGGVSMDLYIAYTPATLQDPGAYAAFIDLGVVDN